MPHPMESVFKSWPADRASRGPVCRSARGRAPKLQRTPPIDGALRVKPIDDHIIELLVRHPSALSEELRRTAENYVLADPFGRAVAQFYRDIYKELDSLNGDDAGVFSSERPGSVSPSLSARRLG